MRTAFLLALLSFMPTSFAQDVPADAEAEEVTEAPAEAEDVPAEAPEAEGEEDAEEDAEEEKPEEPLKPVDVPESDEEAIEDVQDAVSALQAGQWATFGVLLLGLLVFVWNRFTASKKGSDPAPSSDDE